MDTLTPTLGQYPDTFRMKIVTLPCKAMLDQGTRTNERMKDDAQKNGKVRRTDSARGWFDWRDGGLAKEIKSLKSDSDKKGTDGRRENSGPNDCEMIF